MANIKNYWIDVQRVAAELPAACHLTSIEDHQRGWSGGMVVQARRDLAARLIAAGSHRLSTPDEIAAADSEEQRLRYEYAQSEQLRLRNLGVLTQPLPQAAAKTEKGK